MRKNLLILLCFVFVGCVSSSQNQFDIDMEKIINKTANNLGAVVFTHEPKCNGAYFIAGETSEGQKTSFTIPSLPIYLSKTAFYRVTQLKPGKYVIKNVNCPEQYSYGGGAGIAEFNVQANQVSNLGVLSLVMETQNTLIFSKVKKVTPIVRTMREDEIAILTELNAEAAKNMVNDLMRVLPE